MVKAAELTGFMDAAWIDQYAPMATMYHDNVVLTLALAQLTHIPETARMLYEAGATGSKSEIIPVTELLMAELRCIPPGLMTSITVAVEVFNQEISDAQCLLAGMSAAWCALVQTLDRLDVESGEVALSICIVASTWKSRGSRRASDTAVNRPSATVDAIAAWKAEQPPNPHAQPSIYDFFPKNAPATVVYVKRYFWVNQVVYSGCFISTLLLLVVIKS
jgi:hypothetical protein